MISHGKDMKIFTGNANPALAQEICKLIGIKLGEAEVKSFADGEASVSLYETVRGSDVFLINSTCKPVNDSLMELLIMIDACKRASAGRVTAVIPYFGYARQDRKAKSRDPISAKLVANMLTASGADRVLTMDLHASQIQGFFDIPVDNLLGNPVFVDYYAKKFGEKCEDMVVVSPDVGSVARARTFAQKLHMGLAIVDKRRQKANSSEVMNIIGDVRGKNVILLDDMVDPAGSLCHAADALVDIGGILYYLVKDILEAVRFWTLYGSALLGIGLILVAFLPIVAQLPCLLFCWHELPQLLPLSLRRHASRAERKRRAEFRRASAPKQQPNPNWAQNYQNRAGERPYRHKCLVCGRTDTEYPDLEFRYCSKCNGDYEYCSEHLYTHKHVE